MHLVADGGNAAVPRKRAKTSAQAVPHDLQQQHPQQEGYDPARLAQVPVVSVRHSLATTSALLQSCTMCPAPCNGVCSLCVHRKACSSIQANKKAAAAAAEGIKYEDTCSRQCV